MNYHDFFWLIIFAVISAMIVIDPNFGKYLILVFDLLKINLVKYWLMLKYHPKYTSSSLYKWLAMRKYMKIAEKIQKGAKK